MNNKDMNFLMYNFWGLQNSLTTITIVYDFIIFN